MIGARCFVDGFGMGRVLCRALTVAGDPIYRIRFDDGGDLYALAALVIAIPRHIDAAAVAAGGRA